MKYSKCRTQNRSVCMVWFLLISVLLPVSIIRADLAPRFSEEAVAARKLRVEQKKSIQLGETWMKSKIYELNTNAAESAAGILRPQDIRQLVLEAVEMSKTNGSVLPEGVLEESRIRFALKAISTLKLKVGDDPSIDLGYGLVMGQEWEGFAPDISAADLQRFLDRSGDATSVEYRAEIRGYIDQLNKGHSISP